MSGPAGDARLYAPATGRNRDPILAVLRRVLPAQGLVLEVASGSGEHAAYFARHLPTIDWQPSDPDPKARASIAAWAAESGAAGSGAANLRPALLLDASADTWPLDRADSVVCVNMIHIAPWAAALGLLAGAARLLGPDAPLVLYGPYKRGGRHTAPSNAAFDESLRRQNPAWGVRDVDDVVGAAAGFRLDEIVEMPANNLTLVLRRLAGDRP